MVVLPAVPSGQTASWLGLLTARDFRNEELTKQDRQRLRAMVAAVTMDRALLLEPPDAQNSIDRIVTAGEL